MLEAYAEVDKALADLNGNGPAFRLSEDSAHIEGMAQEMASTLFYGNEGTEPEAFTGLAPRFNDQAAVNGENILTSAATPDGTDNTSLWVVGWGPDTCHMIYPQATSGGLSQENLGKRLVTADDSSGDFEAYVTKYKWDLGLSLRDWRAVGRIANIDVGNLEAESSAADLVKQMIRLEERVMHYGGLGGARFAWYMHPRVRTMLRIQALAKAQYGITFENYEGRRVMQFGATPIRASRQLLLTETAP
jgi:hypothetical protein